MKICKMHRVNKFGKWLVGMMLLSAILFFISLSFHLSQNISVDIPNALQILRNSSALNFLTRFLFPTLLYNWLYAIPEIFESSERLILLSSRYFPTLSVVSFTIIFLAFFLPSCLLCCLWDNNTSQKQYCQYFFIAYEIFCCLWDILYWFFYFNEVQ